MALSINTKPAWVQRLNPNLTVGLVVVIGVLALLAAMNIITAVFYLFTGQPPAFALYNGLAAAIYAFTAHGLFRLKRWARFLQLFLSIMMLITGILTMLAQNMGQGIINVIIHGPIAIYLLTDDCRAAFGFKV